MTGVEIEDSNGTISGRGSNFVVIKFIPIDICHFEIIPTTFTGKMKLLIGHKIWQELKG
jgi:hypothetical protein